MLIAPRRERDDHSGLAREALRAAIDHPNLGRLIRLAVLVELDKPVDSAVDEAARLDVVQSADNYLELAVKIIIEVLYHARVVLDRNTGTASHDELGGYLGLEVADVLLAEQELTIKICHIDTVHVNDGDLLDAREGQIF